MLRFKTVKRLKTHDHNLEAKVTITCKCELCPKKCEGEKLIVYGVFSKASMYIDGVCVVNCGKTFMVR